MALKSTPICEFGVKAPDFKLLGTDGQFHTLESCAKEKGLVVMFICNHCPYVKAILPRLLEDSQVLLQENIGVVAICANDPNDYPEDSFDNMKKLAQELAWPFPYLLDETQTVAKAYGAVCTPDFFGFNAKLELNYRGRLDEGGVKPTAQNAKRELVEAMKQIATTGRGPDHQVASQGCSIKWMESHST